MKDFHNTASSSEDPRVLAALSQNEAPRVRAAAARNPLTPVDTLVLLAGDPDVKVALAAVSNKHFPVAARYIVVETAMNARLVERTALCAPKGDKEALLEIGARRAGEMVKPPEEVVAEQWTMVRESRTRPKALLPLMQSAEVGIRRALAKHPRATTEILSALIAEDGDGKVRRAAASNPNLSLEDRANIAQTNPDPDIVEAVWSVSHRSARGRIAEAAANSSHPHIANEWKYRGSTEKCPTPTKTSYLTKQSALGQGGWASRAIGKAVRVYPCSCGAWHHTTRVKKA